MTITTDTTLLHDPRRQAALLYWQGFSVPQIAAMLQMKRPTVQSWKQRDGWDSVAPISRVEMSLEARLTQLIIKPQKTGGDFKEIDLLGRQIERLARVNRYSQTGNEADLNPNVANRNKGGRRKPKKNFFSDEAIEKLEQIFFEQSFEYQLHWYRAGLEHRIRDILKSRQIGATFYFSREALLRALKTGHNQIFLSASKTQAYVFREYIIAFARLVDVDLTGDPIVLGNNGAKLIFLGTNSNTAQSHNGDLYVDEIFWIPNFQVLRKVASGMASQSHLRSTYFSTPSTLAHDAYPFLLRTLLAQQRPLDIWLVNSEGDDNRVRRWAMAHGIDAKLVSEHSITLNHDAGRWFLLGQSKIPVALERKGEQWHEVLP